MAKRTPIVFLVVGFCVGMLPSVFLGRPGFLFSFTHDQLPRRSPSDCNCKCPTEADSTRMQSSLGGQDMQQHQLLQVQRQEQRIEQESQPAEKSEVVGRAGPRKILLDCGANVASTALLFRETYPGGKDYTIHSFEIDDRLSPYFEPYDNLHLHCPVGVAGKDGNMTAFSEMVWGPQKGKNNGVDMQWGGGSLFVSDTERQDSKAGGKRKLSYRKTIPVIDLSQWIMKTFSIDDYIIFKLDVEGAEYEILRKMIDEKALAYVDKYYGEFHDWQPTGWTKEAKTQIRKDITQAGLSMIDWVGERRTYGDINEMNPVKVPAGTPGTPGKIYTQCASGAVALTVQVGMNFQRAHRVVTTLSAHKPIVPTTLFVYGDFVQSFPEEVEAWSEHFDIGIREDGHNPAGHLELMPSMWVRMGLISTILRLEEIGITASYYLPTVASTVSKAISGEAKNRGLRVIRPAVEFPAHPGSEGELTWDDYYRFRDVERVPKALRKIHTSLSAKNGGVLTIDTDLPDTYMNSVFMMDYLVETSGFKLVSVADCISGALDSKSS